MKKLILFFITALIGFSCKQEKPEPTISFDGVKCFSMYRMGHRPGDTIVYFNHTTFYIKNGSLLTLEGYMGNVQRISSVSLLKSDIDSIKQYSSLIRFRKIKGDSSFIFKLNDGLYCGADFGFIDTLGQAQIYRPVGEYSYTYEPSMRLINYLDNLKGSEVSSDSTEILNSIRLIKSKYLAVSPSGPILVKNVKFVPPIIKADEVVK